MAALSLRRSARLSCSGSQPSRLSQPLRPARRGLASICASVLVVVILASCRSSPTPAPATPGAAPAARSGTVTISIVGTNDLHGGITPRDGRGGLALLGGYLNNLRAARQGSGAVLVIDGGDMFQGTLESNLSEGAVVVAAYNALGYTAATVGNHEFDFGPVGEPVTPRQASDDPRGALKARASEARFPFLAANLVDVATNRPVDWPNVRPSTLVDAAGLKVGIIGVMTRGALQSTMAANVKGLTVAPLAPTIAAEASALRGKGADLVVVTAHAGGRCTSFGAPSDLSSCEGNAEILEVARNLPAGAVDAIVAGHTHAGMAHEAAGIPIIESYSSGRAFGRVDLVVDRATRKVTARRLSPPQDLCSEVHPATGRCDAAAASGERFVAAVYEGRPVVPDQAVADLIAPQLERVRELKASSLGVVLDTPLRREGGPESPLGNLFTDILLQTVRGADLSVNNTTGGLRADLPAGPLTYGSLFEVYPFDNVVVRFELAAATVERLFAARLQESRPLPGIGGLRVQAQCAGGAVQVELRRPDGRVVNDDERVVIATTDFLATGGDGIFRPVIPAEGLVTEDAGVIVRAAAADWLRRRGGRLSAGDLVDAADPRWTYPGTVPVRCQ